MIGLIIGAISWAFNLLLDLIPGKIRAALSDAVISVLQPMLMPVVYANMFPDIITRMAIRLQLQGALDQYIKPTVEEQIEYKMNYVKELRKSTVALATKEANEQHYEVPADFYEFCLGHRRKYSSGYWPEGVDTLDASEDAAFELLAQRAQLEDGQRILDLGCGWGSFTLWALERYPKAKVTCISNSFSQAKHIRARAEAMGAAHRLTAVTADVNVFQTDKDAFDRAVSIEMFEHVRNYETLLARVRTWLKPGGKLFVHVFSHKTTPWFYDEGWMAENFFTNGQMPSDDLFLHFQKDLTVKDKYFMNGTHYARTCEAWLAKMDAHTDTVRALMSEAYQFPGPNSTETTKKLVDWRLFYLACAEMFAYKGGEEWGVSHYVFERTH